MTPEEILDLTVEELQESLPEGWTFHDNNGRIHIENQYGKDRIRTDPYDSGCDFEHMHIYDKDYKLLDRNGNIIDFKSDKGHIPWSRR